MSASLIRKSLNGGSLCFPPSHFSIRRLYIAISVSPFIYLFAYSITLQAQQNRNKKLIILSFKIKKSSVLHWILFYPYFPGFHLFPPCLCYVSVMLILLFLLLFLLLFYYTLYYILNSNSAFLISAQLYEAI